MITTPPSFTEGKSFKDMIDDFNVLRDEIFVQKNTSPEKLQEFNNLKQFIIDSLTDRRNQSKEESIRADKKKFTLMERLVALDKVKDRRVQDEIVKEMEEYSRVRRHHEALVARLQREIENISLNEEGFLKKTAKA